MNDRNERRELLAYFLDKNNELQTASVLIIPNMSIRIKTFNIDNIQTGYTNLYFHRNNKIYLDTIY